MINEGREIKVYGTLINHTVDKAGTSSNPHTDAVHNDKISYARQSYDDQFGESKWIDNYQDIINKRVKGITRNTTNPKKGTHVNEDLYVEENLYVEGDVYITGKIHGVKLNDLDDVDAPSPQNGQLLAYNKTTKMWEPADITVEDITNLINRIVVLESMWKIDESDDKLVPVKATRQVKSYGFFDTSVS